MTIGLLLRAHYSIHWQGLEALEFSYCIFARHWSAHCWSYWFTYRWKTPSLFRYASCGIYSLLYFTFLSHSAGDGHKPFAGVIDGGDISSVRETAKQLQCNIKDNTCICHMLNNLIKRMLTDYFENVFLVEWRTFISKLRKSNPFRELWAESCRASLESEEVVLQVDTPTRWSSTVSMMQKAFSVRKAVNLLYLMTSQDAKLKEYQVLFFSLLFLLFIFWICRILFLIGEMKILKLGLCWVS